MFNASRAPISAWKARQVRLATFWELSVDTQIPSSVLHSAQPQVRAFSSLQMEVVLRDRDGARGCRGASPRQRQID